jgi:hypothetical protein
MQFYTYQHAVATSNCGEFLSGARIGSPNNALATIPPANLKKWKKKMLEIFIENASEVLTTTSIVESQHASGCFL